MVSRPDVVEPNRFVVLGVLFVAYTINFIDLQIFSILAVPIKADLKLTDTQLGLLGGLAFAILYSTLAIPLAVLADRTSRTWVITGALVVLSGFTALCGAAANFWQLFLCRLGVGVGEAGGTAPSFAIIADYFPGNNQAKAFAIYSLGIPLGAALGVLLGGYIAAAGDWRTAFVVIGLAGMPLALIFRRLVPEPARDEPSSATACRLGHVFAVLAAKRSFWWLSFAAGVSAMLGYGLAFWLPSLMRRSFGLTLIETSQFYGFLLLIGGGAGVLLGGWLGDRFGNRDRGAYARLSAVALVGAVPLFAAGVLSSSAIAAFALFVIPQALVVFYLAPVFSAVQHLVAAPMRATASACFLFINNLIGLGGGAFVLGALSDALTARYGDEALRYAVLIALVFYLIGAALFALAVKPLREEWLD
ncbi:MFS transporter [Reyranella sp. CPCC 100927]|nr:MFS transporter [Reyranella sp. CPCC 100927]